jgi:hypothetical protein
LPRHKEVREFILMKITLLQVIRKGPADAYIRIVVLIHVLNVELFGSEVEHVTLIVHPDVFGVFEGFQDVLARPQELLEIGRLVGLRLRRIGLCINLCH